MARKELSALNLDDRPAPAPAPVVSPVEKGLRVVHIARAFGARQVVRDVSLTVRRGEVAGLLGPNGAGKTTCFYMITGLIPPDSGSIWLDGEDITGQPMYQRARMGLGYLAQEASIFRGMTVEKNVRAVVDTTTGVVTGSKGVQGAGPLGTINASSYAIYDQGQRVVFKGAGDNKVKGVLTPAGAGR